MSTTKPPFREAAYYAGVETLYEGTGVTPFLVVLGGSSAYNTWKLASDIDLWGHHLEGEEPFTLNAKVIRDQYLVSEADAWMVQFITMPDSFIRRVVFDKTIWDTRMRLHLIENFLACPSIYETTYAVTLRTEMQAIPHKELAADYLNASREIFGTGVWQRNHKQGLLAIRLALTGAYLLETSLFSVDAEALTAWAGYAVDWSTVHSTYTTRAALGEYDAIVTASQNKLAALLG